MDWLVYLFGIGTGMFFGLIVYLCVRPRKRQKIGYFGGLTND